MPLHRGRISSKLEITSVRNLRREDLELVKEKRTVPVVKRLRDTHHKLARLIASGLRPAQAAAESGYAIASVYILQADPAFQDLVAAYRKDVHQAYISGEEERYTTALEVSTKALRHINEHFDKADEEGELIPIGRALQVFSDTSDRTGLVKKSVTTNVNIDFAARLEKAIRKSKDVRQIEAKPEPVAPRTYIEGNLVRKI